MKTLVLTSVLAAVAAGAAFAQSGGPTINYVEQEKAALQKICAASPADTAQKNESYRAILEKALLLNDQQKNALSDYEDTQAKAISDAKSRLCANPPDLSSFEASVNFRQRMLEDELETVKAVNPKLIAFYNSLNDEQRSRFDQMRQNRKAQQVLQQQMEQDRGR